MQIVLDFSPFYLLQLVCRSSVLSPWPPPRPVVLLFNKCMIPRSSSPYHPGFKRPRDPCSRLIDLTRFSNKNIGLSINTISRLKYWLFIDSKEIFHRLKLNTYIILLDGGIYSILKNQLFKLTDISKAKQWNSKKNTSIQTLLCCNIKLKPINAI